MIATEHREDIEGIVALLGALRRKTISISPEAALKIKEAMEILTRKEAMEIILECVKCE